MSAQEQVQHFNAMVRIGDGVLLALESGNLQEAKTRAKAQVLATGEAAVWVEGLVGSFPLEVVTPKRGPNN